MITLPLAGFQRGPGHAEKVENAAKPLFTPSRLSVVCDDRSVRHGCWLLFWFGVCRLHSFPAHDERAHRTTARDKVQYWARNTAAIGKSTSRRVWHPAEILFPHNLKASALEWRSVFLERWQIALSWIFDRPFQPAAECREAIVHVDIYAHSSWPQQTIDVGSTLAFFAEPVAVAKGIDSHNQVERS